MATPETSHTVAIDPLTPQPSRPTPSQRLSQRERAMALTKIMQQLTIDMREREHEREQEAREHLRYRVAGIAGIAGVAGIGRRSYTRVAGARRAPTLRLTIKEFQGPPPTQDRTA